MEFFLPKEQKNVSLDINQSIIILGANGSGKTRLGTWIELIGPQNTKTHRISAQKSLTFPETITGITSIDKAEKDLWYGINSGINKNIYRWHQKPETYLLNDYDKLLNLLFSEYIKELSDYNEGRTNQKPVTKLHKIKKIWDKILLHRELIIEGNIIKSKIKGSNTDYNASEMSDGERVIFYLIGQALSAPKDGIIIIDEPELHLHKSIQIPLWNEIEKERRDCIFVYLTHDVDFATGKRDSKKIWLKSYDGNKWDWEEFKDIEGIPEELQLEIIGTRQKVLFVEGELSSLDNMLYRNIFEDFLIKPCGSCENVIKYTEAFKENSQLAGKEFYGLIDRDRRNEEEIENLKNKGIYTLEVAEIENLFLIPELLDFVSEHQNFDKTEKQKEIIDSIISFLEEEKETQIALRVAEEIKFLFKKGEFNTRDLTELEKSYNNIINGIDFEKIKLSESEIINNFIKSKDYKNILKIYNRKNLIERVSYIFTFNKEGLKDYIIRFLGKEEFKNIIIEAIKKYIPNDLTSKI